MISKLSLIIIVILLFSGTAQEATFDPVQEFIRGKPNKAIDMTRIPYPTKFSLKEKTHIILAKKKK
jgi:hypothetical protein